MTLEEYDNCLFGGILTIFAILIFKLEVNIWYIPVLLVFWLISREAIRWRTKK